MNNLGIVIVSAALGGGGLALLVNELLPAAPKLGPALDRLNPPPAPPQAGVQPATSVQSRAQEQFGQWLLRKIPLTLPRRDLDLLGHSAEEFLFNKAVLLLVGLFTPSVFVAAWVLLGISVPLYAPAVVGLILAVVCWFVPDLMLRRDARKARAEAAHGIAVYLELVALRLASGIAIEAALEQSAFAGRGWVFLRLQDALMASRVERTSQATALHHLSGRLELAVLADIADFARMASEEGASVYAPVRHRAQSLRSEQLAAEAAVANADTEKMHGPIGVMCVLVLAAMAFPALINAFNLST
ncbi:hypothetical protein G3I40_27740 [Streptomyces sp. SID14478]|uniref:hypothetical protein n=1 Tax=Streptomyces sp. SID14478 TaxID=2706073 RepID=UPI0013DA046C|nr:hypothetical protein [Streptomyces sp. SID14478]NEB78983.1 hypothetical protein [Streptomyces sp. SID14478]